MLAAQAAIAVALLSAAAVFGEHFVRLVRIDPGFHTEGVLTAQLTLPLSGYPDADRQRQFFDNLVNALKGSQVFDRVARVNHLPLVDEYAGVQLRVLRTSETTDTLVDAELRLISDGYFEALELPIVRGQAFTDADSRKSAPVVVVNTTFAERHLGGLGVGAVLVFNNRNWQVVGVVADSKEQSLIEAAKPVIYCPVHQFTQFGAGLRSARTGLIVRSRAPLSVQVDALRQALRRLDPRLPLYDVMTLDGRLARLLAPSRFYTLLIGAFGLCALILAALSVYSVTSYLAERRTQEIGVRMAVGANRSEIVRLLLRDGMLPLVIGVGAGLVLAVWTDSLLRGTVEGIRPLQARDVLAATAASLVAGFVGSSIPAYRAARVDPITALRTE